MTWLRPHVGAAQQLTSCPLRNRDLSVMKHGSMGVVRAHWQLARTFSGVAEAHDVSQKCRGSIIVGMFDIGDQIFVVGITGNQTG